MSHELQFYIDGAWVAPVQPKFLDVIDPSTEDAFTQIAIGSKADVDKAVAAAKRAFPTFGFTTPRGAARRCCNRIVEIYKKRSEDLAHAVSRRDGRAAARSRCECPGRHRPRASREDDRGARDLRVRAGRGTATWSSRSRSASCGLITPWNWPLNQIACKVAPALAAGCTMVLKPSEIAPLDAIIFAEIMRRGRRAQGRVQPGQWRRPDGRPGDRQPSRRRHGVVHRLDPRRHPGRQGRRRHRQARRPGARRQVGQHPASPTSISQSR